MWILSDIVDLSKGNFDIPLKDYFEVQFVDPNP